MSNLSLKEKSVLAMLAVVVLYAVAAGCWFLNLDPKRGWCPRSWAKAMTQYENACRKYRSECEVIAKKAQYTEDYEQEKLAMPIFEAGKATDTVWLEKIDALAKTNHVWIAQRQAGTPVQVGDVYEIEISLKNCTGALESFVKFMHALENTDEGMFDIRQLSLDKQSERSGYLKANMTITCAYMRE